MLTAKITVERNLILLSILGGAVQSPHAVRSTRASDRPQRASAKVANQNIKNGNDNDFDYHKQPEELYGRQVHR